jgi:hypothetical protein
LILLAHWLLDHLLPVHSQQLLQAEEAAQVDSTLFVETADTPLFVDVP